MAWQASDHHVAAHGQIFMSSDGSHGLSSMSDMQLVVIDFSVLRPFSEPTQSCCRVTESD